MIIKQIRNRGDNVETMENIELVHLAKKGDLYAFEQLLLRHEKIVYHIVLRMMGEGAGVEDLSQEVFLKVYRHLPQFDEKSAFSTWIYRIAVNTCIDEMRKRKGKQTYSLEAEIEAMDGSYHRQFADNGDTPEQSVLRQELREEVLSAMESLSPEHKAVVVLRDIQGFSYEEISEMTGATLGTVKSRLSRARLHLKEQIVKKRERKIKKIRQKKGKEGNES